MTAVGHAATSPKMVLEFAKLGQGSLDHLDFGTLAESPLQGDLAVSRIGTALTELLSRREGSALVRLLADPSATQPGPRADRIAVWVHTLRLLLTRTLEDAREEAALAEDFSPQHQAGSFYGLEPESNSPGNVRSS